MLVSLCLLFLNPTALKDGYSYLCLQMRKLRLKFLSHLLVISLGKGSARAALATQSSVCSLCCTREEQQSCPTFPPQPSSSPTTPKWLHIGYNLRKKTTHLLRQHNVKARPSDWTTNFFRPFSGHLGAPLNLLTWIDANVSPGNIPECIKDPPHLWLPRLQWLPHRNLSISTSGTNEWQQNSLSLALLGRERPWITGGGG